MPEKKEYEGYIIDTGARGVDGMVKGCVKIKNGVGVLDLQAVAEERPDWIRADGDGFIQFAGAPLSVFVDYWNDKGVKVTECSASEAKAVRKAINSGMAPSKKFLSEIPWADKDVEVEEKPKPKDGKNKSDDSDKETGKGEDGKKKIFSKPKKSGEK